MSRQLIFLSVFKAVVGRRQGFPVKIKANIRTYKKRVIDAFVHYKMGENCACPVLNMTGKEKCAANLF